MKTHYRIPRVEAVGVPRRYVLRLTFNDGLVREVEFVPTGNQGTVFELLEDPDFFEQVRVDQQSGTIVWPNGVDLDPAVLHGDFPAVGGGHLREVSTEEFDVSLRKSRSQYRAALDKLKDR